jgi:outer membrane protein assembly factor BamC
MGVGLRRAGAALAILVLAAGCSTNDLRSDRIDYASATPPKNLDVPPDLSQLPRDERFGVPQQRGSVTASAATAAAAANPSARPGAIATVAPAFSNARIERDGNQRWLAVDVSPEQAFKVVLEFLPSVGLAVERQDPKTGIVETAWAENRANINLGVLRGLFARTLGTLYSTGEQDKFRVRVERTAANTSEIFISHRGMVEVFTSQAQDSTKWQPRPSDPELEAEMLQLLAQRFAAPPPTQTASAAPSGGVAVTPSQQPEMARLLPADGPKPARVVVDEPFDRAWRRVGLALDRGGFTVEDRDRAKGLYFVRYVDPQMEQKQRDNQGLFSRLFGRDVKIDAQQFRVLVVADGQRSVVTVEDRDGKPEAGATSDKILAQINEQLR